VITTDMGGTSFDVGVIHNGVPGFSYRSLVHQYEYYLAKVDVQTVGAGGGSLVRVDPSSGALKVGPESAGAEPGPICYGRGGTVPTVTDADVVLGYLDPDNFAGGSIKLDKAGAQAGIKALGEKVGLGVHECAAGIAKIVEFQMADLIRKVTVRKGLDPRDFVLFAFGGAGPVHAGVFARELGVAKVIVPQKETASVWCAFGAAAADVLHLYEQVEIMRTPFDATRMNRVLQGLKARADADLDEDGADASRRDYRFSIDMRHKGQINEVEVTLKGHGLAAGELDGLSTEFFRRYEALYGRGASLPGAALEAVTFRCRARVEMPKPQLPPSEKLSPTIAAEALRKPRPIYWTEWGRLAETPIYDGHKLVPGNRIKGPCVAETRDTSVVVHPGETLTVDRFGNFEILLTDA
ncbi:MAG: hydantoinase/oxoprolinase family protein, partial [Alphaproteobacteria bacterium]